MVGVEAIFDPESVGDGAGVLIEAGLESSHPPAEIFGGGMAVMIGDILAEPAPERLDRHEVGAVAGQRHEVDVERFGRFAHHTGSMIGGAVPDDDQLVLGPFGSEPAQNIDGVLAVGAGIGPEPHLAFVVEIKAVERELVRQTRRGRGNPEAPAAVGPAIAEIGILVVLMSMNYGPLC